MGLQDERQKSFDRILETQIKKTAQLEERVKELEKCFKYLCISLSIAAIVLIVLFYF